MNLLHLYNKETSSHHLEKLLDTFESESLDISTLDSLEESSVYIVELIEIDKEISAKLLSLFEHISNPLIYFIVPKKHSLMLFQLAFLLNVKHILTQNQNIEKFISKIKIEVKNHEDTHLEQILGKTLINTQMFMLFKGKKLLFASGELLEEFGCSSKDVVERELLPSLNLKELLAQDTKTTKQLKNTSNEFFTYNVKSISINTKKEKIIYIDRPTEDKKCINQDFVSSRITFIETLKDKLLERDISEKNFSIITIQIDNLKKLSADVNKIDLEVLLKEFLYYIEVNLEDKLIFSQYNSDFYLTLYEDISLEDLQTKAKEFFTKSSLFIKKQKFQPLISLFTFYIDDLELNDVLEVLENISLKSLTSKQVESQNIEYINDVQENMSDKEMIDLLLDTTFINAAEFKLLNIYKGLCVNTSSKILKKTADTIYVKFEQLQGIVMHNEGETVLQSPSFVKDIRAKIKHINLQKGLAILENFSFLNANANSRKYSRVTCSSRTPIIISYLGGTLNGDILDISVNSIAIKTKYSKAIDTLKSREISLSFTLPSQMNYDGFVKLNIEAKIVFSNCAQDGICKIVCELKEDTGDEAVLMEYVYKRQKEIIVEVKKMIKNI